MKIERKAELANNMIEYLIEYGADLEKIGIDENTSVEDSYNRALGYIVELVTEGDTFYEEVLGFTETELIEEGMEWCFDVETFEDDDDFF